MTVRTAPQIETERLRLRPFAARDVEAGVAHLASDRAKYMGGPYSEHDAWIHCCHLIGHWDVRGYGLFVICEKGSDAAIGDAGPFFPHGWAEPEIAWGLWSADHEGKGYATEAARATRGYVYGTLGWETAVSYVDPDNRASIAVAERLGCVHDATAALPDLPDWAGTLVFRHPAPEATP